MSHPLLSASCRSLAEKQMKSSGKRSRTEISEARKVVFLSFFFLITAMRKVAHIDTVRVPSMLSPMLGKYHT